MSQGILLVNLGTPESPETSDIRDYFIEFLMDPYVINLPWVFRTLIVYGFILPFRPARTSRAYKKIWNSAGLETGSPLLYNGRNCAKKLSELINSPVEIAMRYGKPSLETAIDNLTKSGASSIKLVPLYPQYAESTWKTTIEKVHHLVGSQTNLDIIKPFFNNKYYLDSQAQIYDRFMPQRFDYLLFSYHGLPNSQIKKADPTKNHCLQSKDCCENDSKAHETCYRYQSLSTSREIAKRLSLDEKTYGTSFQSRVGATPWLVPQTDKVLAELPSRGIHHLAIACPAFVADNLETIEEIGIVGKKTFLEAGGKSFTLLPCLNSEPEWIRALQQIIRK